MPPKQESPVCVWDFTVGAQFIDKLTLDVTIRKHCKKWRYQLEKGDSGYEHFQGRVSLKEKVRLATAITLFNVREIHWSITSKENRDNDFYTCKEESRVEGPWKDTDPQPMYIPRQIRGIELRPWQQSIVDSAEVFDTRHINIILDNKGNIGKTTLKTWVRCHGIGRFIPFVNDYKDMMRIVMDCPKEKLYIIDIPRAIQKDRLFQFYAGIETLKDGYAYDDRYHFKDECFDSPVIWVFTNVEPERNLLSADRWRFWEVQGKDGDLARCAL